ncbi:MAG: glycine zipper 2TM domain-containing protein [Betaproteobacteria bacterium]
MEKKPRRTRPIFIIAAAALSFSSLLANTCFARVMPPEPEAFLTSQTISSPLTTSPATDAAERMPTPQLLAQQYYEEPTSPPPPRREPRQPSGYNQQRSYGASSQNYEDDGYNNNRSSQSQYQQRTQTYTEESYNDNRRPQGQYQQRSQNYNEGGYNDNRRPQGQYQQPAPNYQPANTCRDCAIVEDIREVKQEGSGSGLGAIGGGVVGGLLGNQVGAGRGKTVGAVVGAVGGAYAGNEIEKSARATRHYEITVRFDDGNTRVFTDSQPPPLQRGDRVRVSNGQLMRM